MTTLLPGIGLLLVMWVGILLIASGRSFGGVVVCGLIVLLVLTILGV